jgi:hypothetical protein
MNTLKNVYKMHKKRAQQVEKSRKINILIEKTRNKKQRTIGCRDGLQLDVVEEAIVCLQGADNVATALAELGAVRVDLVDARAF